MWTKTPPTEVGWYWWREMPHEIHCAVQVFTKTGGKLHVRYSGQYMGAGLNAVEGEWWNERIPEPPKEMR